MIVLQANIATKSENNNKNKKMKMIFMGCLFACLLSVDLSCYAQKDYQHNSFPADFKENVFEHILNITDIGERLAATVEEERVAQYIYNEMEQIGLATSLEKFDFESFDIEKTELRINKKKIDVLQLCFNPYTTDTIQFEGDFVLLKEDNNTDVDITGKIVVASSPLGNMSFFSLFFKNPKLILVISSINYKEVSKVAERNIMCNITGTINKYTSQNVVGLLESKSDSQNEIIISAHYDSYPGSIGADDNASGVGSLIELARYFKQNAERMTTNIRFVAFGAEEKGLVGSRAYLAAHKNDIANCKLLLNMDQLGGENIFIETLGGIEGIPEEVGQTQFPDYMENRSLEGIESNWRLLAPDAMFVFSISNKPEWLREIIFESAEELLIPVKFIGNTGSDQMTFAQAGIVSTAIGTSGNIVHSPLDVPSQVQKQSPVDCSKVVIKVVLKTMQWLNKPEWKEE